MILPEEDLDKWIEWVKRDSIPKIEQSAVMVSMVTENFSSDPLCMLQLGAAIIMNKPILIVVDHKIKLPPGLVRAATLIERCNMDDGKDVERALNAIKQIIGGG